MKPDKTLATSVPRANFSHRFHEGPAAPACAGGTHAQPCSDHVPARRTLIRARFVPLEAVSDEHLTVVDERAIPAAAILMIQQYEITVR